MKKILFFLCIAVFLTGCTGGVNELTITPETSTRTWDNPPPEEHACDSFNNGLGYCKLCGKWIGEEAKQDDNEKDAEEEEVAEEDGNGTGDDKDADDGN